MQDNMLNLKIGICNGSTETENFIERMVCKKRKMSGITIQIVKQYISPSIEVDSAPNTEELWKMVIGYFKKNTHSYERFINGFGDLSFVLQEADPVECIKHFNLFRTLSSAQSKYKMGNESYDIPVVLVKAEKSYINMDLEVWNTLFPNNQMLMYPVNHNQIIQEPVASEWINNLNQVI